MGRNTSDRPLWIENPKHDDSLNMYQLGVATGLASEEAARTAAYDSACGALIKRIQAQVSACGGLQTVTAAMTLKGVEVISTHQENVDGKFSVWLQISYPQRERLSYENKIAEAARVNQLWFEAQALVAQQRWRDAELKLTALLTECSKKAPSAFSVFEVNLAAGKVYAGMGSPAAARRQFMQVQASAEDADLRAEAFRQLKRLPPAPLMWDVAERWGNRKVAIVCARRDGAVLRTFPALGGMLMADCRAASLPFADLTATITPEQAAASFGNRDFRDLAAAGRKLGAALVLVVLIEVDTLINDQPVGAPMSRDGVPDTVVRYAVVEVVTGVPLGVGGMDSFKEFVRGAKDDAVAKRVASILVRNYLAKSSLAKE